MGSCCFVEQSEGPQTQKAFLDALAPLHDKDSSVYWLLQNSAVGVKADRKCVMAAVTKNGLALDVAAGECKADTEIILKAVKNDSDAYSYVNKTGKMWKDKQFVLPLVKMQGFALEYANEFKAVTEVVVAAISNRGSAIRYADDTLKADKAVVLAAVKNESDALFHVDKTASMWKDKEFVLAIVKSEIDAFSHVDKTADFWKDRSFVLSMVKMQGNALQFAARDLKEDREVVVQAVTQRGDALDFVCKKANFWRQKDAVLSLVQLTGRALEFASDDIKADKEVVLAAVKTTPTSLKFAHKDLQNDENCKTASGLSYLCPYLGCGGLSHKDQRTYARTEEASFSVKFGIGSASTDYAANFGVMLQRNPYLSEFKIHCPNAWRQSSCDPNFTNINNLCRGTTSTCKFKETQNLVAETPGGKKQLSKHSCWRFSFRYHLDESKKTNGFMIQVQEKHGLGDGQKIETKMAQEADVKIFRTIATCEDVKPQHLEDLETKIKQWYKSGCTNMYMHEIFLS